jgi:hypothetical protein
LIKSNSPIRIYVQILHKNNLKFPLSKAEQDIIFSIMGQKD